MMVFSDVSKSWQPLLWRACGPGKILGVCTLSFISFKTRLRSDGYSHTPKILPGLSGTLLGEVLPGIPEKSARHITLGCGLNAEIDFRTFQNR